ncbi:MAG: RagB/SusD family nutrient uptake outer membrane protein [Lewinella sp.]|nr:RagB/SusD family nutrient uptake outer membrane protein [Lewinella sp.]
MSRAEAHFELGNEAAARADLEPIVARSRPTEVPLTASGTALRSLIRAERRRELALEGHHFHDLKRWELGVEREDCTSFSVNCRLPQTDFRYALPIPVEAMFRNPNLMQNEGY